MATRTPTHARVRPRAKRRDEQEQSALLALRDNLAAIDARLDSIRRPVHAVQNLIGQVKAPLAFPAALYQDLDDLHDLLSSLRTVVMPLSILPAPIGPAARGLKQALEVLAGPPKTGSIGRTRAVVGEIDRKLQPLINLVERIETPVENTAATLDAMAGSIAYLRDMVARVIAHYGAQPPEDVQACAAQLNEPIAWLRAALDQAAAAMVQLFNGIEAMLRSALVVLKPIGEVLRTVQSVLSVFRGKAMKAIINGLSRFANGIKPYVNKAERVVRKAIDSVLKKVGVSLSAFEGYFRKVINALNPMKPIERAIANARTAVIRFVSRLVDTRALTALLEQLVAIKTRLAQALETFLRSQCKAVLDPDGPRPRPRVSSRRKRKLAIA